MRCRRQWVAIHIGTLHALTAVVHCIIDKAILRRQQTSQLGRARTSTAMALLGRPTDFPIRSCNKEQQAPDWSSICNNVFDQYLDTTDDLFAFDAGPRERSSSDDSGHLFEFSAGSGSEQSHPTHATSPLPSWQQQVSGAEVVIEARQPKAKEPGDFWTKTLRALERNAAQSEIRQQKVRTAKRHPDFLSLGGCPSPPALPSSPTDQSFSVQRSRARNNNAANGQRQAPPHNNTRSVSRGRPTGIAKNPSTNRAVSTAAGRKASQSPSKMMTPSRHGAGFRDVWDERSARTQKHEWSLPASPRPSARDQEDEFAAFGSPPLPPSLAPAYVPLPGVPAYEDQLSPLTTTFQHASLHTPPPPIPASPRTLNAAAHAVNGEFFVDAGSVPPDPYFSGHGQGMVSDTAPLFQGKAGVLGQGYGTSAFDFGFEGEGQDPFSTAATLVQPATAPAYSTAVDHPAFQDPFSPIADGTVLPSIEQPDGLGPAGLGISCDPTLVSGMAAMPSLGAPHATVGYPIPLNDTPYYLPHQAMHSTTPSHHGDRRSTSRLRSPSPSPTPVPATDSRARHRNSVRHRSTSRHHRRAKSLNANPRQHHGGGGGGGHGNSDSYSGSSAGHGKDFGGFVNYTPSDSNKILSGVAPSGSSKTKARREKEAADKRRRLSQAAVRAVVEAGGTLEGLERAGLIV